MPRKISQLEAATDVTASDLIQIVDIEDTGMAVSGTNKRATAQLMANELGKLTNITATGSTTPRALANRFADVVNVKDFGAKGDGSNNDRAAFVSADSSGKDVSIIGDFFVSPSVTISSSSPIFSPSKTWGDLTSSGDIQFNFSMFRDEGFTPIYRLAGRSFFGNAINHSGNRLGANSYGTDSISQNLASWTIKNSQLASISSSSNGRIGLLGASWVQPSISASSSIGVFGLGKNDGIGGSSRGGYFEVISSKTAGISSADVAAEFQVGNRTSTSPTVSPYDMSNSIVNGLQIAVESQHGYTTGDSDTAYTAPTYPAGCAIDISGGSINASYQKWTAGIVFRNGSLVRDPNNFSNAIMMAQKHRIEWEASSGAEGAAIWSEVTSDSSRMAIAIKNNELNVLGPIGQTIAVLRHDTTSAGTVNFPIIRSSRTNVPVAFIGSGNDSNVSIDFQTKGTGITRFLSHSGSGESLRVEPSSSAPNNFLIIKGGDSSEPIISAAGVSTDIDIKISTKGSGLLKYGTHSVSSDAPISGYIEIKDSAGNIRKLAVIS
jgi:hypothetical protein